MLVQPLLQPSLHAGKLSFHLRTWGKRSQRTNLPQVLDELTPKIATPMIRPTPSSLNQQPLYPNDVYHSFLLIDFSQALPL